MHQHPDRGFITRVQDLRKKIAQRFITSLTSLPFMQGGQLLQEVERQRHEDALLEIGEKVLTTKLFQSSSLNVFLRRLSVAKPEELQKQINSKDPLVRFLVVNTIRRRFLHLELELIVCLKDPSPAVREAAHRALCRVSHGTDFGPPRGASRRGIERSIEKWKHWVALQKSEAPETLAKGVAIAAAGKRLASPPLENLPIALVSDEQSELSEAAKRSEELVNAKGNEQMSLLARLGDSEGIENTNALVLAIPKLSGDIQRQARDALAQRLTRMTEQDLRDKLQDDNVEVRRGAALACGRKKAKEHIADLLQLLDDPEMDVIQAARMALTELTRKDFGPTSDADNRGRADAADAWHKWWKEHQDRQK